MMSDNMRKFIEAVEADADLRAKIEALQGSDDAVEQTIAIAADCGYTLTAEDFDGLAEEDFQEGWGKGSALDIEDLEGASGGIKLIEPPKSPKYIEPFLKILFKVKREQQ
jgi:predicted ribosomally synthesized peptide with nif11-like leader